MKKTTSKELSKKLTRYSAFSAAIAGVVNLNAQAGYTDIPDVTISLNPGPNFYDLNMDNYGLPEFTLKANSYSAYIVGLTTSASMMGKSESGYDFVFALNSGEVISGGLSSWFPNGQYRTLNLYYSSSCYGNWCDVTKFVGVRFKIGADTHYGWIRLTVPTDPNDGVIIHDYYYNPTATELAEAGQFALGIEEETVTKVKIVALNKTIALYNLPDQTNYRVFNMSGQQILDGKIQNKTHIIEANTLANGIYIIELKDSDTKAVLRKKVVL